VNIVNRNYGLRRIHAYQISHLGYGWEMKRSFAITASVLAISFMSTSTVHASPPSKKFKNCTELRRAFPKGVAKDSKSAGSTGATVNSKVYKENIGSDRDKDGVACELA
jgi:hypothetical protein